MDTLHANQLHRSSLWWRLTGALTALLCVVIISYLIEAPQISILLILVLAAIAGATLGGFIYAVKNRKSIRRKIWAGIRAVFAVGLVMLAIKWKAVSDMGGQIRQAPFRIAGNLYYVGTTDVTSFLITSPQGHVLIDGGYPGTADMIMQNIGSLGFRITDVKVLLNSHGHLDHAGGLAALQKVSGAKLWVSKPEADMISSGGASSHNIGVMNFLVYTGLAKYPAPRIDHLYNDGEKIHLGATELTAHITPGHTPGCTSWSFFVQDSGRNLLVVSIGSLTVLPVPKKYKAQLQDEFKHSFQTLRNLPADIFLGSHAGFFHMREKRKARDTAADPVAPFIDRDGYLKYIARAEEEFNGTIKGQ